MVPTQVILVGGAPGAGKTTLARALAMRLGWPWLSGDDLAVAARAMASPSERPDLHPMSPMGHTQYFTTSEPAQLIKDAMAMELAVWPALQRVIESHVRRSLPVVIDWWLFTPATIAELDLDGLASVWLHIDPDTLWIRERMNSAWAAESDEPDQMLANFMNRSLWRNDLIKMQATKTGLPLIHQPGNHPVSRSVQIALDQLGLG